MEAADQDDIFEYEGNKGTISSFTELPGAPPKRILTDAEKKKKEVEDARKAIKKRKSLVNRYLADIGCRNRRLELVIRRKIEVKKLKNKIRREHRTKNLKEPEKK